MHSLTEIGWQFPTSDPKDGIAPWQQDRMIDRVGRDEINSLRKSPFTYVILTLRSVMLRHEREGRMVSMDEQESSVSPIGVKLLELEQKFGMSSAEFLQKWVAGEIEETFETGLWAEMLDFIDDTPVEET